MKVANSITEIRDIVVGFKKELKTIALVPTMGNLHCGHLALVEEAKKVADRVVVSVFVNPMQFDRAEDLKSYPRTLENDLALLEKAGVDAVFTPTPEIMYPQGLNFQSYIEVPDLCNSLEGALRPGHFRGVATVVSKLFNIVQPDFACFGLKDYQQVALIKEMVRDLNFQLKIVEVPIVRYEDGLAYSSRNNLLNQAERSIAPLLNKSLKALAEKLVTAKTLDEVNRLVDETCNLLDNKGFRTDDITVVDALTLNPEIAGSKKVVILASAYLGKVRLIDNLVVDRQI
ncbi:MAG: pantoate--beta-alanine ligase [Ruminobacter sp.]|jgi:pantoate--beta-alanine ligase|uniref:Pantothenate synthetase n=1 Tax=Ruminobacter amylophilus TaxID=867 RepID=A0A662ZDX8_9GAMM|nr:MULTISPECIES: pantoate--beta-alanine ligase [Ruminobacter]MBQ3776060.1 pantoate--beta-alanine ligase [Ruminobacter sp.]SFO97886.1 pantoate--beta-alanine ligase [Ruminobacter amylophilus]